MPRLKKSSPNPAYTLTAEKYATMLKHYVTTQNPTVKSLMDASGVGRIVAKRALMLGWPELNLPPLINAAKELVDPIEVHKQMASMQDKRKEIEENLFGALQKDSNEPIPADVITEVNRRAAESGMAARIAQSVAVKSARAVEKFIDKVADLIEQGEIELPEKVRMEHLLLLAKAADTAAGSIYKATQVEKLTLGEPDNIQGAHVAAILIGATKEEIEQVAMGGPLPKRLLGINTPDKFIDVEPNTSAVVAKSTLEEDSSSAQETTTAEVSET